MATSEECPCCFDDIKPGASISLAMIDRAIVVAFASGAMAIAKGIPPRECLCPKHHALVVEVGEFMAGLPEDATRN